MAKTILITGASSGIGLHTALHFAQNGWQVLATMRNPVDTTELRHYENVKLYPLDVTRDESIRQALDDAVNDFGRIDVLLNNAGFSTDGVFEAMTDEDILKQFDTNLFGLMRVTRAILPHMREMRGGIIIQTSSMGGRITFPLYSIYHATKWAVEGFTESLQYEVEPFNIRLKLVEPGAINTDFYGRSRRFIMRNDLTMYAKFAAHVDKVTQLAAKQGASPEVVAAMVYQAATDGKRRLRYPVGYPAPMILLLRKLLPDNLFFTLVKRVYRLS